MYYKPNFSFERRKNINIFLSACKDKTIKVKTLFKNASGIEKLERKDWEELLKTLQSFSKKMEANSLENRQTQSVPGFILNERSVKSLIRDAKHENNPGNNYALYGSPYQELTDSKDLYDRYNMVSRANFVNLNIYK